MQTLRKIARSPCYEEQCFSIVISHRSCNRTIAHRIIINNRIWNTNSAPSRLGDSTKPRNSEEPNSTDQSEYRSCPVWFKGLRLQWQASGKGKISVSLCESGAA